MERDVAALQSAVSSALVATTRSASALANEDLPFHRSLDASIGTQLDRQNARLLDLATGLLGAATSASETVRPAPSFRDIESIENNWRAVVDVVDSLLERADTALDEFTGAVRRLSPGAEAQAMGRRSPRPSKISEQLRAQDMEKPQLQFEHVPTNRERRPFKPLLETKPYASVPLDTEPVALDTDSQASYAAHIALHSSLGLDHKPISLRNRTYSTRLTNRKSTYRYPHPYQLEIEQYLYPPSVYTTAEPTPYHPFETTSAIYVDTEEKMQEMLEELKKAKEIAVDLEHHDQRSYIGIVCLMQISTRNQDWIVDTLKPWRRKLQCLNAVFANPNILKVLHGAHMDAVWLQRDLGLYLVGLFDTHHAARALGYQGGSLAFLLKKFVDIDAQKQYQQADWRVRPLPQELIDYARSDTHYLLYIFDCMRNELIERSNPALPKKEGDKLYDVLTRSAGVALQRYEHPEYDAELGQGIGGWYKMLTRTPVLFSKEQFSVFRAVHKWRDDVCREEDEGLHYVMPNWQIFSIAREMPTDRAALLGITQPSSRLVRLRADELVAVIISAKEAGKDGPEMLEVLNKVEPHTPAGVVKRELPGRTVAPFVPKPAAANVEVYGTGVVQASTLPLRSSTSAFWGEAFRSSAQAVDQQRSLTTAANGLELSVPMPALTAEVFANPGEVAAATPVRTQETPADSSPLPAETSQEDDVFVLRELSKKRKRPAEQDLDGVATNSDEVALPNEETERLREKAERKQARKEAKRAEKQARREAEAGPGMGLADTNGRAVEESEPFDYASAPSILNPPRMTKEEMKERRKKEINPYAKAMDAPKGLARAQRERAGRSMTYK